MGTTVVSIKVRFGETLRAFMVKFNGNTTTIREILHKIKMIQKNY